MMDKNVLGSIHHIGIAVNDVEEAKKQYFALGYSEIHEGVLCDTIRRIKVVFMEKEGYKIELISPLDSDGKSPVDRYIKPRRGYVMYHIAYCVRDLEYAISYLKEKGFIQIENISAAALLNDRREVYLYQRKMGLVELIEDKEQQ